MSVLDLKTWVLVDFYRSFICWAFVKTCCLSHGTTPLCHHCEIQLSAPLTQLTPIHLLRPSLGATSSAFSKSSPTSSPTIQVGAPPLVSPWAPRHQILPTFPAARIATSSMMCNQCLLTDGSVSDFLTDILGKGLCFYVVIRIRPQCLSA